MIIETARLALVALSVPQLKLWLTDLKALEAELGCHYEAEPLTGEFRDIVQGQLAAMEQDQAAYYWHSFWFLIDQESRIVVGLADFKDSPDDKGEVEIGYGLGQKHEHHGYMTEAVQMMCAWALTQEGVQHIIAETDLDGYASQRILKRCGFTETVHETTSWWRR